MDMRRIGFVLSAAVLLLAGCSEKNSAETAPAKNHPEAQPPMQTIARVHWIGMKQVSSRTNAVSWMSVWNLPETRKLEQQTLEKLSLAPWRLLHRDLDTNIARLFQPLLNDIVSNESCLEIRQATNEPEAMVFAIRLDDQRAALWQTNLARVLESLTGIQPVPAQTNQYGWSLKKHHAPDFLELTRAGDWTIFGASSETNSFLAEIKSRIQQNQSPVAVEDTNNWLEADADPALLCDAFSLSARVAGGEGRGEVGSTNIPSLERIHLSVSGDGSNVLTHATADFAEPLHLHAAQWEIPTELINKKVSSFTVARGFESWLESSKFWQDLEIGPPPDQICCWGLEGLGMMSYFAAPVQDASNDVSHVVGGILKTQQAHFPTNQLAKFERSTTYNGLEWRGLPYMSPFLRSITVSNRNFVFGGGMQGGFVDPSSMVSLPPVLNQTNLLYHDWEITGQRVEQWLYMSQFARFVSHKPQVPFQSAPIIWLKAVSPKLAMSVTDITQTGSNQLAFTRKSTIGFTGIELNLLADWLESPQFPVGLHTFLAPAPKE